MFFDSQVAGGLSTGLSVRETVIKETNEEANLPKHIATQMKPAGCVRYLCFVLLQVPIFFLSKQKFIHIL